MRNLFAHVLAFLAAALILQGCNLWEFGGGDGLCELTVSISVSAPSAASKSAEGTAASKAATSKASFDASDYVGAMTDGEKMQTLRIVIVRPDGSIEHNRLLDFSATAKGAYTSVSDVVFEVIGGERKKIYLFANENARKAAAAEGVTESVVQYDLASLAVGGTFPEQELSDLRISLNSDTDELPGSALPMSECHTIDMPASDYHTDLYITRAAVKFSYLFDNQSGKSYELSSLTISKASSIEYYLPRVSYAGDPLAGDYSVSGFEVPNTGNNNYYLYKKPLGKTITAEGDDGSGVTALEPFYLLEGKYLDSSDSRNYSMSVTLDGTQYSAYFPDVASLPRNTHVVVVITIGTYGLNWSVDVFPYGEVILNPGFGQ